MMMMMMPRVRVATVVATTTASRCITQSPQRRWINHSQIGHGMVQIVEVGPRCIGLQNESKIVSLEDKIQLIDLLAEAGCCRVEVGSFVVGANNNNEEPQPLWRPMAEQQYTTTAAAAATTTQVLMQELYDVRAQRGALLRLSCLVGPAMVQFEQALTVRPDEIAIAVSASPGFSQTNSQCTIDESLDRYRDIVAEAAWRQIPVRAYLSCVIACPYEGPTAPQTVGRMVESLLKIGCQEISLDDTTGVGQIRSIHAMLDAALAAAGGADNRALAVHFYDTYGRGLHNILLALERGITKVDSSIAGIGTGPFVKGAAAPGNVVATEDVVAMLDDLDVHTGIDLENLVVAGDYICRVLGRKRRTQRSKDSSLVEKSSSRTTMLPSMA